MPTGSPLNSLDIGQLPGFDIPKYTCTKCRAITSPLRCHVCRQGPIKNFDPGVTSGGTTTHIISNKFQHAEGFATVVPMRERYFDAKSVVERICENSALYIHIVTYSIDSLMLDYLEDAMSRNVEVAGFIGRKYEPTDSQTKRLAALKVKYPQHMHLSLFEATDSDDRPHQKILVCDGCVAVTGSMNFTRAGFDKQFEDAPKEFVWPFLDLNSVAEVNNKYISPLFVPQLAHKIRHGFVD